MPPKTKSPWLTLLHALLALLFLAGGAEAGAGRVSGVGTRAHTEVHTYFVAGHSSAAAVWVHNTCLRPWEQAGGFDRLKAAGARVREGPRQLVPSPNLADTLMRNVGGPSFPGMRHHMHKFEVMKQQYGVMGRKFAEKAARAEEIIRQRVAQGGGRFGRPVGQGEITAIYYADEAATYVFRPSGELWSIRSNLSGN